jgi:hypothetical protein
VPKNFQKYQTQVHVHKKLTFYLTQQFEEGVEEGGDNA